MFKSGVLFSIFLLLSNSQFAFAQQHIEDCESFLDSDLTLLCYQHSIVAELEDNHQYLPTGTIALTITEDGEINDLIHDQLVSYSYGSFHYLKWYTHLTTFHWIPTDLPTPKVKHISENNYYKLVVEVFPTGHVVPRSDLEKREF